MVLLIGSTGSGETYPKVRSSAARRPSSLIGFRSRVSSATIANPSGGSDFKSSMMPSRRLTDDTVLRRLAGAQSYQRGLDYFSHGHVESLEEADDCIRALEHMERETGLEPATSSLGKRSYFVH